MSDRTRERLDEFWELIDEILNVILFVLIGLEVLVLVFTNQILIAGLLLIPIVLVARLTTVAIPVTALRVIDNLRKGTIRLMTWGGIRGGISVALALSLPPGPERRVILGITYVIVVFSIVVQGLTMGKLVKRIIPQEELSK